MTTRVERLKKLLAVQEQLKALHEVRHAGFVAEAAAAKNEAAELVDRFNAEESLSALFPGNLSPPDRLGAGARGREPRPAQRAKRPNVATATARTNMVERTYREVRAGRRAREGRPRAAGDRSASGASSRERQVRLPQVYRFMIGS